MTPARFQTIEEIYRAALDQEPDHISAFLSTACQGDEVLRHKVEALLTSRERAASFIETSAIGLATKIIRTGEVHSLVGQTIGHYKISESIGTGGMGEVYLATDIVAGRKAALKLLPLRFTGDAERLKRFQQEAHAVVGLNHPNIVTVYEIGEDHSIHYIASELIKGETLRERLARGRMDVGESVDVAIQVASALAAAHEAGIVHRDIKPENIMLRPDGYVKVLDFGIAKLAEQEVSTTMSRDDALLLVETNLGAVLGTVRYMSPEQACGGQIDKSTDIWSLGVVLYEMVTGHVPFTGDTPREVMSSILEKEPPPVTRYIARAPAELQQIISKALRKDRAQRYATAHDLLQALKGLRHKLEVDAELERSTAPSLWLRWIRSPTAVVLLLLVAALALVLPFHWHRNPTTTSSPEKSIAVLPFENRSQDKASAYFADGIQDEILTRLSKIADLKVVSRTSTQHYKSAPENLPEIAKQLGVAHILEGSVQKSGDAVRVNVQLIKAANDSHLWADTFDRNLSDIFSVESEVARAIADQLRAKLTGQEEQAISARPTDSVEAYDAYLRGLAFDARSVHTIYSPDLLAKAGGFYGRAVELDPKFALAWARASRVNAHLYFEGSLEITSTQRDAAKRALEEAQKLEPNSPETLLALGYYQYWVLRDYGAARTTFERVSEMLPGSSEAPAALARVMRREGNWNQSIAYFERALALDPRNMALLVDVAETYSLVRQFSAALKLYDRVLDISPNDPDVMAVKASIYQAQGDLQGAAKLLSEIDGQTPSDLAFSRKVTQLRFERNYGEAIRRLQARLAQFHYDSQYKKTLDQLELALIQRVAGDWAGARVTAEQSRDILERLYRDESHMPRGRAELAADLSRAYAVMGEKDSALKTASDAVMLLPRAKDPKLGPAFEENLALIQTMFGENGQAISTLAQLLQTSYNSWHYGPPAITQALLRLDPIWDPIRNDPRFQELVAGEVTPLPEKSIAVLPFENLNKDEENASLAGGVQDEILTDLAKIADLKVISRTSVMQYKSDSERNLREIAKALGVSYVVEGSVQRAGERVRVSAQLIDARNDTHVWAEHYDRDVADVFGVQTEIAQEIADQLEANLSPVEKAAIAERPTTDLVAYAYYRKAKEIDAWSNWDGAEKSMAQKIGLLEKAVQRDPNFALAYCALAKTHASLSSEADQHLELAKKTAEAALQLRPDLGEAHLELARYYFLAFDYDRAREELTIVRRKLPNNAEALVIEAMISRHQNRWDASLANLQKASELDPRNGEVVAGLGEIYLEMRRYSEFEQLMTRAAASGTLERPTSQQYLAQMKLAQGDPVAAQSFLDQVPMEYSPGVWIWNTRFDAALYLRNYDAANRLIAATPAKWADFAFDGPPGWAEGQVARARSDKQKAMAAFAAARKKVEAAWREKPKDASYFADVARLDAGFGRKQEAIREAERAVELQPITKDSLNGPSWVTNLALVYAWTGERDRALEQLEIVATIPGYSMTFPSYGDLRFNPRWDDLRGDPRFDKIVAAAKAASK